MTHNFHTLDPKESKQMDSDKDFYPMQNDEVPYPDQFDESKLFIKEDES